MKRALITGIAGQDGSYLAEWLLGRGYSVFGTVRRSVTESFPNLASLRSRVVLLSADMTDAQSIETVVAEVRPDEVYNLAAQSFVPASFRSPVWTADVTALGAARLLEAVRRHAPGARYYQASSSEMFGKAREVPQRETTPFHPRSPYGASKAFAHDLTVNYRESYGLFAVSGILFSHESERRGLEFVSRKATDAAARARLGLLTSRLRVGNLVARRDWGYAPDYVRAMWMMLQRDEPEDFVIATGVSRSVSDLLDAAFGAAGLSARDHVEVDPSLHRPAEVESLVGDASKARGALGWKPEVGFDEMIRRMVEHDEGRHRGLAAR
jgi:GDPmannose 4,6-dehydratase